MADRKFGIETLCLHAGQIPDPATGARAAPIYQTTSFVFDSADHAASLFNLQTFGNVYSRISNPTVAVFEERMAAIEGARSALAAATGQAAEVTAILTLCSAGDHIVSASTLYGGTHTLLQVNLKKLGIETTFVDPDDPQNFRKAIKPNTKLLYAETLGNPLINMVDIEALAAIAHDAGIPLVLDNTVPSPYLCRPVEWGADIVVHSATKYIGGHGTTMGGVIVESGKFNWGNGKFPEFTSPSPGYHGVIFHETFGDFGYTMKARMEIMRTFGPALSPMNAWLLLQGMGQLPRPSRQQVLRAGKEIPAERRVGASELRRQGRRQSRRALHRGGAVHEPSRQYRRREDARDPPGLHHPPADERRGPAQGRREAGHGAHFGRHRIARRYPVGHRSGVERERECLG